jgi:hypothetical protein
MPYKTKQINFGEVDHFLYVRILCICADLGYTLKDFVEQSYCLLTETIDEKGTTHFKQLEEQYRRYADIQERVKYAPRNIEKRHPVVVDGIHEEMHQHLVVIKDENKFPWVLVLAFLLLAMEAEIDKKDDEDRREGEVRTFVVEEFLERRTAHEARNPVPSKVRIDYPYHVEKTDKRREFERKIKRYPERDTEDDED